MNRASSTDSSDSDDRRGKPKAMNKSNIRSNSPPISDEDLVVKLRGLPWSCTVEDIVEFFKGCKIEGGRDGVHLVTTPEGRSSGEAFVEVVELDMADAIKKDKKNIGHRYIEVFKVKRAEMDWVMKRSRPNHVNSNSFRNSNIDDHECVVRMRGLPFECCKDDILQFFAGKHQRFYIPGIRFGQRPDKWIVEGWLEYIIIGWLGLDVISNGIQLMFDSMGRSSGEAYVRFKSKEIAEKALLRDRQCIGHRYIEIFRVGASELRSIESMVVRNSRPSYPPRPSPYDRNRGNTHNGPNNRFGSSQRPSRYFGKESWSNNYGNDSGSWNRENSAPPPPPPPPRRHGNHSSSSSHCLLMRGLPFKANEGDIRKFFDPLVPMGIHIIYDSSGRPSGTAKVQFACGDDMTRAMGKHREKIFTRYIELFVSSN